MKRVFLLFAIACVGVICSLNLYSLTRAKTHEVSILELRDTVFVERIETEVSEIFKIIHNDGVEDHIFVSREFDDGSSFDLYSHYRSDSLNYDCIIINNNTEDGNLFLFFNHADKQFYLTPSCFAGFYPIEQSVNFNRAEVFLQNKHYETTTPDTLFVGNEMEYIGYNQTISTVQSALRITQPETEIEVNWEDVMSSYEHDEGAFSLFISLAKSRCADNVFHEQSVASTLFDNHFTTLERQRYPFARMFVKDSVRYVIDRFYNQSIDEILFMLQSRDKRATVVNSSPMIIADMMCSYNNIIRNAYTEMVNTESVYTKVVDDYLDSYDVNQLASLDQDRKYFQDFEDLINARIDSISFVVDRDQTMRNSFDELQQQGISISSSDDGALRVFSREIKERGINHKYINLVQYRINDSVSRVETVSEHPVWSDQNYGECNIKKVHHLVAGVYLLEGKTMYEDGKIGSIILAYDISKGILKKAFLFQSKDIALNQIKFPYPTDSLPPNVAMPEFRIDGQTLLVPVVDSLGGFEGEYTTYFYNFGFFETEQEHIERIATSEEGMYYITRIFPMDGSNSEAIDHYEIGSNLSMVINISHRNDGSTLMTDLDKIDLKMEFTEDQFAWSPTLYIRDIPLIKGVGYVENMDITSIAEEIRKQGKQRLWGWAKPKRVLAVSGFNEARMYQKLRYTAILFTPAFKKKDLANIKWAMKRDGQIELLDPQKYSGAQIELTMPHGEPTTIQVIPYLKRLNEKVFVETFVY